MRAINGPAGPKPKMWYDGSVRNFSTNHFQHVPAARLTPIACEPFIAGEGGIVNTTIVAQLEPILGRLLTPITAHVQSVFVPVQAIHAFRNSHFDEHAGNTESMRKKMVAQDDLFGLVEPTVVDYSMNIHPRRVNGEKITSDVPRLAYYVATNYLRKRLFPEADLVPRDADYITPALYNSTILQRFNAVLDPDDHINGAVNFSFNDAPVRGIMKVGTETTDDGRLSGKDSRGYDVTYHESGALHSGNETDDFRVRLIGLIPQIYADNSKVGDAVSLQDFYRAQKTDRFTREFRKILEERPFHGEEIISRLVHGLSVDGLKEPFVVYDNAVDIDQFVSPALDGESIKEGVKVTNGAARFDFAVPIPKTELGGVVVTMLSIKPQEVVERQPHPILSGPWPNFNHMNDVIHEDDYDQIKARQVSTNVAQADEDTVMFYTGRNEIYRNYHTAGLTPNTSESVVSENGSVWVQELPASVTSKNVHYTLDQMDSFPFAFASAGDDIATISVKQHSRIKTPIQFGSTPVETLEVLKTDEVFEGA